MLLLWYFFTAIEVIERDIATLENVLQKKKESNAKRKVNETTLRKWDDNGADASRGVRQRINQSQEDFARACKMKLGDDNFNAANESGMWEKLLTFRAELLAWLPECNGELQNIMYSCVWTFTS